MRRLGTPLDSAFGSTSRVAWPRLRGHVKCPKLDMATQSRGHATLLALKRKFEKGTKALPKLDAAPGPAVS
jgi:hypothetical protein